MPNLSSEQKSSQNSFKEKIAGQDFLITCELSPPKGPDASQLKQRALNLKGLADAINITDGQGGNMRMSSVVASYLVEQISQVPAICQLVCRDRNSIGLQSDILGAEALGLKNFLALSGDKAAGGDNPKARDVFELFTDDLIRIFESFGRGIDLAGNELNSQLNDVCIGAAAHPGLEDLGGQAKKMALRADSGVHFFQTQIVYEEEQLKRFLDSIADLKAPTLIGLTPLKSVKMAQFMNEKVFGVEVPAHLIERLEGAANPQAAQAQGQQIALELSAKVKELGGRGVHLMAIGQEDGLAAMVSEIKEL